MTCCLSKPVKRRVPVAMTAVYTMNHTQTQWRQATNMKTILLLSLLLLVVGCSQPNAPDFWESKYNISLTGRLPQDAAGFYHLTLSRTTYQTTHRLSGELTPVQGMMNGEQRINWESSHYWWFMPGDTAVTVIRRNVNDQGQWVNVDTLHWTSPDSLLVPTTNPVSYTTSDGKFSGMIAPTIDMLGDTMTIKCRWYSQWYPSDTVSTFIRICLE